MSKLFQIAALLVLALTSARAKSVYQTAVDAGLTTLVAAVDAAGFKPVLNDPRLKATVFAPTNAAFNDLIAALNTTAADVLKNTALLKAVLSYHVVPKTVFYKGKKVGGPWTLTTLLKQAVTVVAPRAAKARVYYGPLKLGPDSLTYSGSAQVVTPDVKANRAVVHVIDKVLVPALPKAV